MPSVLFLGNSHLSAVKLAYDEVKGPKTPTCIFFCARGADLAFTEVSSGTLRPVQEVEIDEEEIRFAFPDMPIAALIERYSIQKQPMEDVGCQFTKTGGASEIDLANVAAVFYVVGVSPYDFIRLREHIAPVSRSMRRQLLDRMLGEKFLLRRQLAAIRHLRPECKHYFIGTPLLAKSQPPQTEIERLTVIENRHVIRSMARDFLFDDLFMPGEELLDETLLSTKAIYLRGGLQESQVFQKETPTRSDLEISHMNRAYGKHVFREFIEPHLQSLSQTAGDRGLHRLRWPRWDRPSPKTAATTGTIAS